MRALLAWVVVLALGFPASARDPDGRYANSPLKQWFDGRQQQGSVLLGRGWHGLVRRGLAIERWPLSRVARRCLARCA